MVGVIDFDYLNRWSRLGAIKSIRVLRDLTRQRWINFSEKEGNMRKGEVRPEVQADSVLSNTLTIMQYLNGKRKKNRPISMVVLNEKKS